MLATAFLALALTGSTAAAKATVLQTNDDGWAVANIRATNDALNAAGYYNVILSAPSENKSGTGSSTATPTVLNTTCEFDTCPVGSPAIGFNATNPRLAYVNAYPVDSARYGIQYMAPAFFGSKPQIVLAGPNVGWNLGTVVNISGTVGAATEAAKEGVPAVAFSASGSDTAQVAYTTLYDPATAADQLSASSRVYAGLVVKFTDALLANLLADIFTPILPTGTILNVNLGTSAGNCSSVSDYKFVFTRVLPDATATDIATCGSSHLPDESTVVNEGCYVSVSVVNATIKADVGASTQRAVYSRFLPGFFSCYKA